MRMVMGKDQPQRPAAKRDLILQLEWDNHWERKEPQIGSASSKLTTDLMRRTTTDDGGNIAMATTKLRHLYQPTTVQTRLKPTNPKLDISISQVLEFWISIHSLSWHNWRRQERRQDYDRINGKLFFLWDYSSLVWKKNRVSKCNISKIYHLVLEIKKTYQNKITFSIFNGILH